MIRLIVFILLCCLQLPAQKHGYIVQLIDPMLHEGRQPVARVTISDTLGNLLKQGYSDSTGRFKFETELSVIQLRADSAKETCDGIPGNFSGKIILDPGKDTVRIRLGHLWVDRWPNALIFDEGSLNFTSFPDSLQRCDFEHPDPKCSGFESLDVLLYEYNLCEYHFSKLEIRTCYTTNEGNEHGNSLALKRAEYCINYFKSRGMQDVEFLVEPIPYATRPLKNADGTIRTEEICVIMFRVLAW